MRIVYVTTRSDAVGGAHIHIRDLSQTLMGNGHEVVVAAGGSGPFSTQIREAGVRYIPLAHMVRPVRPLRDALCLRELVVRFRELQPELVSLHSSKAGLLGRVAARLVGIPAVFTAHGWAFTEGIPRVSRNLYRLAETAVAPLADKIVTVSNYDLDLAARLRVAKPPRLVAIHNGRPDVPQSLLAEPSRDPCHLIMVARMEPQKDHVTLLRALAELPDTGWHVSLVGGGPLEAEITALTEELGLSTKVSSLGTRPDVAELLARAQVFVLASRWEGLPRSIIEAMRAGMPVVASDVGGVAELVTHGDNGFLVSRGDVSSLAGALQALVDDPSLRERMGRRSRERYLAEFTLDRMVAETERVYEEVLTERGRRWDPSGS